MSRVIALGPTAFWCRRLILFLITISPVRPVLLLPRAENKANVREVICHLTLTHTVTQQSLNEQVTEEARLPESQSWNEQTFLSKKNWKWPAHFWLTSRCHLKCYIVRYFAGWRHCLHWCVILPTPPRDKQLSEENSWWWQEFFFEIVTSADFHIVVLL